MNKLFRRMQSLLIVIFVCFGLFVSKSPSAKAIKNFTVEVTPSIAGEVAEYKFQFTIEKELKLVNLIQIIFPPTTGFNPPMPTDPKEKRDWLSEMMGYIFVASISCREYCIVPIFQYMDNGSLQLTLHATKEFLVDSNPQVDILIRPQAGITNPGTPGTYTYKMMNQQESTMESQPVEITEKLPTPKLEMVAQLPVYDQIMWLFAYPSIRKVKLYNDHPGLAYVKTLDGGLFETYYILGLYDTLEKRIVREIYLCSERDLKDNNYPTGKPAILVDENNQIFVTLKQKIYVFDNYLYFFDILSPDLNSLHISSLLRLNFFKNNSIVALRDGIVLFIDKTSGVLTDHIAIDKSTDPDMKGLKTVSLQDYTKDSILMYFSVDEEKAQNIQKVVTEVDITTKTIKQKWIINKENYPMIPYNNNFFSLSYANPWFIFWTPCPPQNSTGVQLFIINTKTNQETLLELPLCSVTDQWLEKEGDALFAYIRCPDGSNDNRQEGIYRFPLNEYLP